MGSQLTTPTFWRALLLPDERFTSSTIWEAQSTYTQQDPQPPGFATAQQDTNMALQAIGERTASTTAVDIQALRGGFAGRNQAGAAWQYEGDARWRGRDDPTSMSAWEALLWTDGSATVTSTSDPHVCTLGNDVVLCAYQQTDTSSGTTYELVTQARAVDGTWGSAIEVRSLAAAPTTGFLPCLVPLEGAEAILLSFTEIGDTVQVQVAVTKDSGATWTDRSVSALDAAIDADASTGYTFRRIRAAYDPVTGHVALVIHLQWNDAAGALVSQEMISQYVSDDFGATFTLISTTDPDVEGYAYPSLVAVPEGGFLLWLAIFNSGSPISRLYRAGDGYEDIIGNGDFVLVDSNVASFTASSKTLTAGETAMAVADDGTVWLYGRIVASSLCRLARSLDGGLTIQADGWEWFSTAGANAVVRDFVATWQRGRVLMVHQWDANPGNEDNSVGLMYLGGWSTCTMPFATMQKANGTQLDQIGIPIELPGDLLRWTKTGTGTDTLSAGYLGVVTVAGTSYYTNTNGVSTPAEGIVTVFEFQAVSGGSLTTDDIAINLRLDDGSTSSTEVTIRIATATGTNTDIRLYDEEAGAQVGSDIKVPTDSFITVIIGMNDSSVSLFYRISDTGEDREFTAWGNNGASLTDGGGSSSVVRVRFGNIASASANSRWKQWSFVAKGVSGIGLGLGLAGGQESPADQYPGPLSSLPIYYADGLYVRAVDGPASEGDEWQAATRYTYGLPKLYTDQGYPSPRDTLRSEAGSPPAALSIAWQVASGANELFRPSIAAWVVGNFKDGSLEVYNGGWQTAATINMADGLESIPYTRAGGSLQVTTGGAAYTGYRWIAENELAGATVDLGSGKLRRIIRNSAGVFTNQSTTKTPKVWLDPAGVDGTEPSSGSMDIWMPQAIVYRHLGALGQEFQGVRIVADSQNTVDGDLRLKALIGGLYLFGDQPSYGTTIEYITDVDLTTLGNGRDRALKRGPSAAVLELSFADEIGTYPVENPGEPSPDYKLNTSGGNGDIDVVTGSTPADLPGLMEQLGGPLTTCVYIHDLPADGDEGMITQPKKWIYGRAFTSNSLRTSTVAGDETKGGIERPETIVIRRVV